MPPKIGLVLTIIGESKETAWSPHWAAVASTLKAAQIIR
jgi:hypothetical protein